MFLPDVNIKNVARESGIQEYYCLHFLRVIKLVAPPLQTQVKVSKLGIDITFSTNSQPLPAYDVRLSRSNAGPLVVHIRGRQAPLTLWDSIPEPTLIDRLGPRTISFDGLGRVIRRVQGVRV